MFSSKTANISLEELVRQYREHDYAPGTYSDNRATAYGRRIYGKIVETLSSTVIRKYEPIIREMELSFLISDCFDYDLSGTVSIWLAGTNNRPLVKFEICLNIDKFNDEYINTISEKLSTEIDKRLEPAFTKWAAAMAEYYAQMQARYAWTDYTKCLANAHLIIRTCPLPAEQFLSYDIVVLD